MTSRRYNAEKSSAKLRRIMSALSTWALERDAPPPKDHQRLNGARFSAHCRDIARVLVELGRDVEPGAVRDALTGVVEACHAIGQVQPKGQKGAVSIAAPLLDGLLVVPVTDRGAARNAPVAPLLQCPSGALVQLARAVGPGASPAHQGYKDRVKWAFRHALLPRGMDVVLGHLPLGVDPADAARERASTPTASPTVVGGLSGLLDPNTPHLEQIVAFAGPEVREDLVPLDLVPLDWYDLDQEPEDMALDVDDLMMKMLD